MELKFGGVPWGAVIFLALVLNQGKYEHIRFKGFLNLRGTLTFDFIDTSS